MRPLILIWVALFPCVLCCLGQRDIRIQEKRSDRMEKERKDLEHLQDKIAITYDKNSQGEYVFTCHSNAYCNYIVEISFSDLQNLQADVTLPYRMDIPPGSRRLLTLRPQTKGSPVHFSYHHRIFKGCISSSVDTNYTYLLPVPPGRETRIYELTYLAQEFGGAPEPKGWYALSLHVHSGDTVFAARQGRVTEIHDNASLQDSGYRYAKEDNYVEIAHNDCSFGRYKVFRDNSIFVQPGEWVKAGQAIGIAGGDKYAGGPQIQFEVRYHQDAAPKKDEETGTAIYWAYVPLQFWVKEKGSMHLVNRSAYTSEHPAEMITKEMSKKEAKKWTETHKSS